MTSNRTGYRVIALASGAALIAIGALDRWLRKQ